jgi:hypothetical protein
MKAIPLGILRGVTSERPFENVLDYMYTNPSKKAILHPCDKVFILGQAEEAESPFSVSMNKNSKTVRVIYFSNLFANQILL